MLIGLLGGLRRLLLTQSAEMMDQVSVCVVVALGKEVLYEGKKEGQLDNNVGRGLLFIWQIKKEKLREYSKCV